MNRRFSRSREPKKYSWIATTAVGNFNSGNVAEVELVNATNFALVSGQRIAQVLNIVRIIGSVSILARTAQDLDNIADAFVAGPAVWGMFVQDVDDASVIDPANATAYGDEICLGTGITELIGIGIDTNAFVGGTGLQSAFAHQYPFSTKLAFDVRSNRRMSNDQLLRLNLTRPSSSTLTLGPEEDYQFGVNIRVLVKLP